ncbi:response regulator [Rhizobium sp. TH2]|uniref:GAF domain-containing hybrid sensor histidine kinase/response regulator n=1 Tax=Rhizobium sp. TH2 TaxID=2775403 RepID=UPI0021584979|nr:response regulator [Rhizobium sp. TH2]UVC09504.1 response regulator [Rhizobium sp. TH2]
MTAETDEQFDIARRLQAQEAAFRESEARYRRAEDRYRFLEALARETAASTDADAILAITTRMVGEHLNLAICAYADMDADQDGFTIRGDWSAPGSPTITGHYMLHDFGVLAMTNLHAGKPLVIHDNRMELAPEEAKTFQDIGIAATICLPLVKEGRLTALMAIHDKVPHHWSDEELVLLTEVTERSWAHIERVRAEANARESERRFRLDLERMVAERTAELVQSQESIRAILETTHLYQGLLDIEGRVRFANLTALDGIQSTLADVFGKPFWETPWFTGTPDMPEAVKAAVESVASGKIENISMTLTLPVGIRSFDFSMRPVKNPAGEVVALVPEAVDITARVEAEHALLQSQKMEAIGNLTGGVAHDFNNLLMAISGSLELLRKRLPDDPALLHFIDNALEGAKRGSSLVQRMMAFARRQELKNERIDIRRLVGGMAELLARSLGPMVTIETRFSDQLPEVETDANQLESALLNLVVNARDAMSGKGEIIVEAEEMIVALRDGSLEPGHYVRLAVTDTGTGMGEAVLKRAMEPFFTTKGVGKGTGLGLSTIHGLAKQSGGTLRLKSKPGDGTTAEIWLPAKPILPVESAPVAETIGEPVNGVPHSLAILAVDDDALVLMNTVDMLEDLGHRVTSAYSGKAALELMSSTRFDIVITDHAMPQMTGAQLIAEIRARDANLPVILATGYAQLPPDVEAGFPKLSKPFSQADLERAVESVRGR